MSQPCAIQDCKRASRTLCHCCDQNLCRDHFNEHDDLLNFQLNPLTDEINALADRLTAINIDKIINDSRQKLNQWRIDSHKIIDQFYEKKCQELKHYLNEIVNKPEQEILDLRLKIAKMINMQQTTNDNLKELTSNIQTLKQQIAILEDLNIRI